MKKTLTFGLALAGLAALVVLSGSGLVPGFAQGTAQQGPTGGASLSAGCLICKRPAIPEQRVGRCHGDWHLLDNTNNWTYQAVAGGADTFVRSNGNSGARSCTKCPNGGRLRQDYQGQKEDLCVKDGQAAASTTPSCPPGFTWNCNICKRPAIPEQRVGRCHGDWHLLDNTNNWTYQAVAGGADTFVRSNGNSGARSCTKCPNGGRLRQDYQGQKEDLCVKDGQAAATVSGACPLAFTLGPI